MTELAHNHALRDAHSSQQPGDPGREPGKSTLIDAGQSGSAHAGRAKSGSLFGGVPWDRGHKPTAQPGKFASPLDHNVGHAGAHAGAAIHKTTTRPGGIAEKGFSGTARPLPFQDEMEQSFGRDLSGVKVYADANAKQATDKLGAEAYVVGNKIAFNTAAPDRCTVAHELTHVLQHTGAGGARPANGETDARGIDMAGEHEAEAVEAAVGGGKHAASALTGACPSHGAVGKKHGPARKTAFSGGLTFSPDGFKPGASYKLWEGAKITLPIALPLEAFANPSVTVTCGAGANWGAEDKTEQGLVAEVAVSGGVDVGLSLGDVRMAAMYGYLAGTASGSFTYSLNDESWSLVGALKINSNFAVGVSVGGGIIDYKFEFGQVDLATLANIRWVNGTFSAGDFQWGEKPKEAFGMLADAAHQGAQIVNGGITLASEGVQKTSQVIGSAADWTSSTYDNAVGAAGAYLNKAKNAAGNVIKKGKFW